MKFGRKIYFSTLAIFLACLYICIAFLSVFTYRRSSKENEDLSAREFSYISSSFERDFTALTEAGNKESISLLINTYCEKYAEKGIALSIEYAKDSETADVTGKLLNKKTGGVRYIKISEKICGGQFIISYSKDVSKIDRDFKSLVGIYIAVSAAVSVILSLLLYFAVKKILSPLERLKAATEKISSGDMEAYADESGNDELSTLAKSFNSMLGTIKSQMGKLADEANEKQRLVDNMAHELRTPLTSIKGYAEYIEKAAVSEEEKIDSSRCIIREANRLKKISEMILESANLRADGAEMVMTDISEIADAAVLSLRKKAELSGVLLEAHTEKRMINGNATLLGILLGNLTENAINACDKGGKVKVICTQDEICIEDNGRGLTKEQISHITEPFYRTDKARSRANGGAGLGLSLCEQIADIHGLRLVFESEPQKNTKVFLVPKNI